jgi:hypothetical protein
VKEATSDPKNITKYFEVFLNEASLCDEDTKVQE